MKNSEILSSFAALFSRADINMPSAADPDARVWDACQLGVVLRAVLVVQTFTAVGALFQAPTWSAWVADTALWTAATLPATLLWLMSACALKRPIARQPLPRQWAIGIGLGVLAGLAGCALLAWATLLTRPPWAGSAAAGGLMSGVLVAVLVWRAKAMLPAGTEARLTELQSRIRPHFLFNTLNSAIALVRAEPSRAEELLEDLSELFRHALGDARQAVSLAQELELAKRYIGIEQVRFGERLRVEWSLDPEADGARLPPLILQPLVENAVKHGVEPSPTGASLRIVTRRSGNVVVVKVINTVPAGKGRSGNGLALANVRERLALLHDVQGQFRCGMTDGVYQVRLELPL